MKKSIWSMYDHIHKSIWINSLDIKEIAGEDP